MASNRDMWRQVDARLRALARVGISLPEPLLACQGCRGHIPASVAQCVKVGRGRRQRYIVLCPTCRAVPAGALSRAQDAPDAERGLSRTK